MKNAKARWGNLLFWGCLFTIGLSYYFENHSLLPVTYGLLFGYLWRVFAECLEEQHDKSEFEKSAKKALYNNIPEILRKHEENKKTQ